MKGGGLGGSEDEVFVAGIKRETERREGIR